MIKLCMLALTAVLYLPGFIQAAADISVDATGAAQNVAVEKPVTEQSGLSLSGKIITIDPGHQIKGNSELEQVAPGSNEKKAKVSSGTKGAFTGKYEYEVNLEVALKLKDKLEAQGAVVYMVRESHDVDISNIERAQFANNKNSDISVRIHADGSTDSSVRGFSVLIPGNMHIKNEAILEKSAVAAECIEKTLITATSARSRGIIVRNDLTGFNWLETPSVLIEMGFMSNEQDDRLLSDGEYQNKIADGIALGLVEYLK